MRDYFIRRFLLIPPTLLGITFIVFAITRAVARKACNRSFGTRARSRVTSETDRSFSKGNWTPLFQLENFLPAPNNRTRVWKS
jgi:ABC-type dipeptide/oligopeptide/nickel transport system permease component